MRTTPPDGVHLPGFLRGGGTAHFLPQDEESDSPGGRGGRGLDRDFDHGRALLLLPHVVLHLVLRVVLRRRHGRHRHLRRVHPARADRAGPERQRRAPAEAEGRSRAHQQLGVGGRLLRSPGGSIRVRPLPDVRSTPLHMHHRSAGRCDFHVGLCHHARVPFTQSWQI